MALKHHKEVSRPPHFEDGLPVSSDELIKKLDAWGINYKHYDHEPLSTVAESKRIQERFLNASQGGGHIKNLYLRDHRKKNILLVAEQDRRIDLKELRDSLGAGRLSFGSSDRLMENLGVRPGAVSPFSMITGVKKNVSLFLDIELKSCVKIYAHPLVNNRTLELSIKDLELFFEKVGAIPNWINL